MLYTTKYTRLTHLCWGARNAPSSLGLFFQFVHIVLVKLVVRKKTDKISFVHKIALSACIRICLDTCMIILMYVGALDSKIPVTYNLATLLGIFFLHVMDTSLKA